MSFLTLAQLEARIRYRYDIETMTTRHPPASLWDSINDAYRTLRERLTSEGSSLFLTTLEASQSGGRTAGYPGTLLVAPLERFQVVHEVHIQFSQAWMPLRHSHLQEALTSSANISTVQLPQAWCLAGISSETATIEVGLTGQGQRILVTPPFLNALTVRVIGMLECPQMTSGTDELAADMGLYEYLIVATGIAIAERDDDVQLFGARVNKLEQVYQDLKRRSKRRDPGAARRVDVRRGRR